MWAGARALAGQQAPDRTGFHPPLLPAGVCGCAPAAAAAGGSAAGGSWPRLLTLQCLHAACLACPATSGMSSVEAALMRHVAGRAAAASPGSCPAAARTHLLPASRHARAWPPPMLPPPCLLTCRLHPAGPDCDGAARRRGAQDRGELRECSVVDSLMLRHTWRIQRRMRLSPAAVLALPCVLLALAAPLLPTVLHPRSPARRAALPVHWREGHRPQRQAPPFQGCVPFKLGSAGACWSRVLRRRTGLCAARPWPAPLPPCPASAPDASRVLAKPVRASSAPAPWRRLHLPPRDPSVHVPGRRLHARQRHRRREHLRCARAAPACCCCCLQGWGWEGGVESRAAPRSAADASLSALPASVFPCFPLGRREVC